MGVMRSDCNYKCCKYNCYERLTHDCRTLSPEATLQPLATARDAVRRRIGAPGVAGRNGWAHLSASSSSTRSSTARVPSPPIGAATGMLPIRIEHGITRSSRGGRRGRTTTRRHNAHGGWIATMLGSCVGCAVHSTLPAGRVRPRPPS